MHMAMAGLYKIRAEDQSVFDDLMSAEDYQAMIDGDA